MSPNDRSYFAGSSVSKLRSAIREARARKIAEERRPRAEEPRPAAEDQIERSRDLYATLLEGAPAMLWKSGIDAEYDYFNATWLELTGRTIDDEVGAGWTQGVHPDDFDRCLATYLSAFDAREPFEMEYRLRDSTGGYRWIVHAGRPFNDPADEFAGYIGACFDLTERRRAESARHEAEERFERAFSDSGVGMAIVGVSGEDAGRFIEVNDSLCALLGYPRELLTRMRAATITHPEDRAASVSRLRSLLSGEEDSYTAEERCLDASGEILWVEATCSIVRDGSGKALYRILQLQDIGPRKRFEAQLRQLADHDPLTGLYNRRRLEEELNRELAMARRYRTSLAVLAMDLDNFKYINDSLGHTAGDELLTRSAEAIRGRLRDTDIVARLGGDEFAVVLPRAEEGAARRLADSLVASLRDQPSVQVSGHERQVTASIGMAIFHGQGKVTAEELLLEADIAMYDAKEAGRDRAVLYDVAENRRTRVHSRLTWVDRIRAALDADRFVLHAQPIRGLNGDTDPRYELLLRMAGESGELILPDSFLPVAERFHIVGAIDRWVAHRAINLLAEHQRVGRDIRFEVNISGRSMTDPQLMDFIAAELERSGADPRGLCLEVTETETIVNLDRARGFADTLRRLGCQFALDDFGAGFASFYYLKHLTFDLVKIDGEFIRNLAANRTNQLVVKSVVDIARGLGKKTVAESVEDEQTLDLVHDYGVHYAQGFHLGRPEALDPVVC